MEPDPDEQEHPGEEDLDWDEETASQFKGKVWANGSSYFCPQNILPALVPVSLTILSQSFL